MRSRPGLAGLLLLGVLSTISGPALADKVRADKLFEDGRRYLQRKEYALACTAFEQSQQAEVSVGTQLNIALCYEQWGKLAAAHAAYGEAEQLAKARKDSRAKLARSKVNELEPRLARLTLSIPADADPYAIFLFDGKETERATLAQEQLLDAGTHTVEVRVAGAPPKLTSIALAGGERTSVVVELPAPPKVVPAPGGDAGGSPAPTRPTPVRSKARLYGGIGLAAGGAVAMGIAGYVALVARSDYNDAIAECPGNVCVSRIAFDATQDARSRANAMTFVTVGGVAMIGAGVALLLTSKIAPTVGERVSASPMIAPGALGLSFGGSL